MDEKADSDLVKRQNRLLVLETLRRSGDMARVDLGRRTGLSLATISSISGQLLNEELIEPVGDGGTAGRQKRGRPLTLLGLNPRAANVLAVKLSIDGIELALADFKGAVQHRELLPVATFAAEGQQFGSFIATSIGKFLERRRVGLQTVGRIGVAVQGLAASASGEVPWSPAFSARNIAIAAPIERELGIPVMVGNDANMIAEAMVGEAPRQPGTTAVIFVGYGVGMGLIIDGAVYHGDTGAAAEFGHMNHIPHGALCRCGRRGCVEAYAADYAIARSAQGGGDDALPPHSAVPVETMLGLEAAARSGDAAAVAAFAKAGEALGFGIARLIAILNLSRVVMAGPGIRFLPLLEASLRAGIADGVVEELRRGVEFETAPVDTDMIIKGTIDSALRHLDREVFARRAGAEQTARRFA